MRSEPRYHSPMLILRPHPWTYHPVTSAARQQQERTLRSECRDGPDAPARSEPRSSPLPAAIARLIRWLGFT